jgi:hypothetical protein
MAGVGSFFVRAYWLLRLAELARHTTEKYAKMQSPNAFMNITLNF